MGGRVDFETDTLEAAEVVLYDSAVSCAILHSLGPFSIAFLKRMAEFAEAGDVFARFRLGPGEDGRGAETVERDGEWLVALGRYEAEELAEVGAVRDEVDGGQVKVGVGGEEALKRGLRGWWGEQ